MCSDHGFRKQSDQSPNEEADMPTRVESPLAQLRARLEAQFIKRVESGEAFECAGCALAGSGACH